MSMVTTKDAPGTEVVQRPSIGAELKGKEGQFQAALPAHIPVERFMRVVMTAIQNNPKLAHADRASLWTSSIKAAQDGLLPDGREGALVIYRTKGKDVNGREVWIDAVQWMPMIAGIRKKVRNSGEIATWDAQVVHAKDEFEYELGDEPFIKHKPSFDPEPGPVIAAYSVATLKTGEKSREVMTRAQLEKVRNASKSKDRGPWIDWFEEMCRKSVARRHAKALPMSTDLDDLIRRDDALYDMTGAREQATLAQGGKPLSLAGKLDALASGSGAAPQPRESQVEIVAHDHDTGEVQPEQVGDAEPPAAEELDAQDETPEDPRDAAIAEVRAGITDGKRVSALLNGLGERRALLSDDDVKALREDEKRFAAARQTEGAQA